MRDQETLTYASAESSPSNRATSAPQASDTNLIEIRAASGQPPHWIISYKNPFSSWRGPNRNTAPYLSSTYPTDRDNLDYESGHHPLELKVMDIPRNLNISWNALVEKSHDQTDKPGQSQNRKVAPNVVKGSYADSKNTMVEVSTERNSGAIGDIEDKGRRSSPNSRIRCNSLLYPLVTFDDEVFVNDMSRFPSPGGAGTKESGLGFHSFEPRQRSSSSKKRKGRRKSKALYKTDHINPVMESKDFKDYGFVSNNIFETALVLRRRKVSKKSKTRKSESKTEKGRLRDKSQSDTALASTSASSAAGHSSRRQRCSSKPRERTTTSGRTSPARRETQRTRRRLFIERATAVIEGRIQKTLETRGGEADGATSPITDPEQIAALFEYRTRKLRSRKRRSKHRNRTGSPAQKLAAKKSSSFREKENESDKSCVSDRVLPRHGKSDIHAAPSSNRKGPTATTRDDVSLYYRATERKEKEKPNELKRLRSKQSGSGKQHVTRGNKDISALAIFEGAKQAAVSPGLSKRSRIHNHRRNSKTTDLEPEVTAARLSRSHSEREVDHSSRADNIDSATVNSTLPSLQDEIARESPHAFRELSATDGDHRNSVKALREAKLDSGSCSSRCETTSGKKASGDSKNVPNYLSNNQATAAKSDMTSKSEPDSAASVTDDPSSASRSTSFGATAPQGIVIPGSNNSHLPVRYRATARTALPYIPSSHDPPYTVPKSTYTMKRSNYNAFVHSARSQSKHKSKKGGIKHDGEQPDQNVPSTSGVSKTKEGNTSHSDTSTSVTGSKKRRKSAIRKTSNRNANSGVTKGESKLSGSTSKSVHKPAKKSVNSNINSNLDPETSKTSTLEPSASRNSQRGSIKPDKSAAASQERIEGDGDQTKDVERRESTKTVSRDLSNINAEKSKSTVERKSKSYEEEKLKSAEEDASKTAEEDAEKPRKTRKKKRAVARPKVEQKRPEFHGWDDGKELAEHEMTHLPEYTDLAVMLLERGAKQRDKEAKMSSRPPLDREAVKDNPKVYLAKHGIQGLFMNLTANVLYEKAQRPVESMIDTARQLDRQAQAREDMAAQFPFLKSDESKERLRHLSAKGNMEGGPSHTSGDPEVASANDVLSMDGDEVLADSKELMKNGGQRARWFFNRDRLNKIASSADASAKPSRDVSQISYGDDGGRVKAVGSGKAVSSRVGSGAGTPSRAVSGVTSMEAVEGTGSSPRIGASSTRFDGGMSSTGVGGGVSSSGSSGIPSSTILGNTGVSSIALGSAAGSGTFTEVGGAVSSTGVGGGFSQTTIGGGGSNSLTSFGGGGASSTAVAGGGVSSTRVGASTGGPSSTGVGGGGPSSTGIGGGGTNSTTAVTGGGPSSTGVGGGGTNSTTAVGGGGPSSTGIGGGSTNSTTAVGGGGPSSTGIGGGGTNSTRAVGGGGPSSTGILRGGTNSTTAVGGGGPSSTGFGGGGANATRIDGSSPSTARVGGAVSFTGVRGGGSSDKDVGKGTD